jgi:hypothetical protein
VQGKLFGKRSQAFAEAVIEATSTALSVGGASIAPPTATSSVQALSATARFVGGAGAAKFAAEEADARAVTVADTAAALTVGGAGVDIGGDGIRGATLAVGAADSSATALCVGGADATVRYTRWAAHTVHAALLSLCTAGEGSASVADLRVGAACTIHASRRSRLAAGDASASAAGRATKRTSGTLAINAVAATALLVLITLLRGGLAEVVGSSLADA